MTRSGWIALVAVLVLLIFVVAYVYVHTRPQKSPLGQLISDIGGAAGIAGIIGAFA